MKSNLFLRKLYKTIDTDGQQIIFRFFIIFSRFECALKSSGFADGNDKQVKPNWDTFTASIKESFEGTKQTELIIDAISYLEKKPPKVQNIVDGKLNWYERKFDLNTPQINRLSLYIRDIRNNLFHGGKFNGYFKEDIPRTLLLLNHSITILNYWIDLSPEVRRNFL